MLDKLASMLENLSPEINVEMSCNIVFKHRSKSISTVMMLQAHPLKQVSEFVYLGVVLMDNLVCTSDLERSKHIFFKQHNSIYKKNTFTVTNVLLYIFRIHALSFYSKETLFLN